MTLQELGQEALKYIIGAGGATGLGALFLKYRANRSLDMQVLLDRLDKENEELKEEIDKLKAGFHEMQISLLYIKSAHYSSPFATWVKNRNGIMMTVNDAYENLFLKPRGLTKFQYLGYKDSQVWPEALAKEYAKNDAYVMEQEVEWRGYETVILKRKKVQWRISKWPVYDDMRRKVVGIAGMAFPEEWI